LLNSEVLLNSEASRLASFLHLFCAHLLVRALTENSRQKKVDRGQLTEDSELKAMAWRLSRDQP
jgi:hypothetical protein